MRLAFLFTLALVMSVAASSSAQDRATDKTKPGPGGGTVGQSRDAELIGPMRILVREVKLDDVQMDKVQKIWNAHTQAEKKLREELRPRAELTEKMGELRRAMSDAYDARDKEKVESLRKQLEAVQAERTQAIAPLREKLEELQGKLHDDLLGVMKPEQTDVFERVWSEQLDRREIRRAFVRSPNALKAAVDRLKDLTTGQKEGIQKTLEDYKDWMREARQKPGQYAAERKAKTKKLYDDVLAQLTPEQREQVSGELEPDRGPQRRNRGTAEPQRPKAKKSKPTAQDGKPEAKDDKAHDQQGDSDAKKQ